MRGERVAQHMRMDVGRQTLRQRTLRKALFDNPWMYPATPLPNK